jgi:hypothetical protein
MRKLNLYLLSLAAVSCLYTSTAQAAAQHGECVAYVRYKKYIPLLKDGKSAGADNAFKLFIKWSYEEDGATRKLTTYVNEYPNTHQSIQRSNDFIVDQNPDSSLSVRRIVGEIPAVGDKKARPWSIEEQSMGIGGIAQKKWKVLYGAEDEFNVLEDSVNCVTSPSQPPKQPAPKLPQHAAIYPVQYDIKYVAPIAHDPEPQKEEGVCANCSVS